MADELFAHLLEAVCFIGHQLGFFRDFGADDGGDGIGPQIFDDPLEAAFRIGQVFGKPLEKVFQYEP